MPNRILRDAILDSTRYHAIDKPGRLAFLEMILCADDYGVLPVTGVYLRRHCTAFDGLSQTAADAILASLMDQDLLRVYTVPGGAQYAYIPRFGNTPRSAKPKWPAPPLEFGGKEINALAEKVRSRRLALAKHLHANAPETETETETGTETGTEKKRESGAAQAQLPPPSLSADNLSAIPKGARVLIAKDWELPTAWGEDAEALGWQVAEVIKEAEKFRQYWVAGKGLGTRRSVKGWRQSWSNWLSKAERYKA